VLFFSTIPPPNNNNNNNYNSMSSHSTPLASQASTGFSDASHYDKHRPTYPAGAVSKLLSHLGIAGEESRGVRVVEIGSGTGKFTELLVEREE
jgi:hypothetical protein